VAQPYRKSETATYLLNYHLIWCPKRRRKILGGSIAERLEQLLRETAQRMGCEVIALAIQPDHVHFFVSAPPDLAPMQLVQRFKGSTSRILREEFPGLMRMPSLWTRSYFVSTAGNVASETVWRYIQEQSTRD
jgi:putative transposase